MTVRTEAAIRDDQLALIRAAADAGSGPATLKIYTGPQPATANTAPSGTLLATITMADPCFEAESGGVMDFDANPDLSTTAVATGTAGWARLADSDGTTVIDGTVGTSGTDFIISTTSITAVGQVITFLSGSITNPA